MLDEIFHLRGARGRMHVIDRGRRIAVRDVVGDAVVEQDRILGHDADRLTKARLRHTADILSVELNRAGLHIVEAKQQARQRALARAALANHSGDRACRDNETDVLQNRPTFVVVKRNVVETHFRADRPVGNHQRGSARIVGDFPVRRQQRKHAVQVRERLLDLAVQHPQEVERDV